MESWRRYVAESSSVYDIIDSGVCGGEDDDPDFYDELFYHATPSKLVRLILKQGLVVNRNREETFNTQGWSKGKIFLSYGFEQAVKWQVYVAEQLLKDVAILGIRLTKDQIEKLKIDTVSEEEGDPCSFFAEYNISPNQIEVVDYGEGTGDF
jgi:hypothetical protein